MQRADQLKKITQKVIQHHSCILYSVFVVTSLFQQIFLKLTVCQNQTLIQTITELRERKKDFSDFDLLSLRAGVGRLLYSN